MSIKDKTITANGKTFPVPTSFFNTDPELRNTGPGGVEKDFKAPTITLKTLAPSRGDFITNEPVTSCVTLTAASAYLEGMRTATVSLADGQTLVLRSGYQHGADYLTRDSVVTFHTADFADITHATQAEVATLLEDVLIAAGALVHVHIIPLTGLNPAFIRIEHQTVGPTGSLQILSSSTATALKNSFPSYEVAGRPAGTHIVTSDPPEFYDFDFSMIVRSERPDYHMFTTKVVEQMFKIQGSPNQRAITISGNPYNVRRNHPIDDPLPREGVFITTTPFVLENVPILGGAFTDIFNGGNWDGTGIGNVAPPILTFELRIASPGPNEELLDIPDAEFEIVLTQV